MWRPVGQQLVVGRRRGRLVTLIPFVRGSGGQDVAEHFVEPAASLIRQFVHPTILHWCHDGDMGLTEKAKEFADIALEKAGVYSEKAAAKAAELSDVAREKAPGYLDRAAELAGKAVDSAAAGVDKATGGRFHEQIEGASTKVGESLDRARHTTAAPTGVPDEAPGPVIVPPAPPDAPGQAGVPVTPAATNPDATKPDATKPDATKPDATDTGSTPGPKG
jgi:hypothetical protein